MPQPDNMLSYNRYVYVHNNPVNYVDPDGHLLHAIFFYTLPYTTDNKSAQTYGQVYQVGANIAITIFSAGYASGVWGFTAAAAAAFGGAVAGFTQSFVASGGNVGQGAKGAVLGGASAAITFEIAHGASSPFNGVAKGLKAFSDPAFYGLVATQALVQGVFSELQGGEFRDGAIGAVFSKIGSGLSGGQSINVQAAVTASFAYLGAKALGSGDDDAIMQAMGAAITVFLYNQCSGGQMCRSKQSLVKVTELSEETRQLLMSQGVERKPHETFIFELLCTCDKNGTGLPDDLKNNVARTSWGRLMQKVGLHDGWQIRIEGGYHLSYENHSDCFHILGIYLHFDAFDPMDGLIPMVNHGIHEVSKHTNSYEWRIGNYVENNF